MQTNSDTPKKLYVGLDMHKEKTVPALLGPGRSDQPEKFRVFQTTQHGLEKAMRAICKARKLKPADLHVCYEASGCGFWIAHHRLVALWESNRVLLTASAPGVSQPQGRSFLN